MLALGASVLEASFKLMEEKDLKQLSDEERERLADMFGVSPATIERWLSGKSLPPKHSRDTIELQAGRKMFGVDTD